MYAFCYATLVGSTIEEVERKIDGYRKYPFFTVGAIHETRGRFKHLGQYMAIVNYFNNN